MSSKRWCIVAIIPARSGSKSVPHKNIRSFAGKPLMAWSIEQARASKLIDRVLVSTDSRRYARIARRFGAEVPFLRPAALARDFSTDLEVFQHALRWLKQHEGKVPDAVVHLRPTCPLRPDGLIDNVVRCLLENPRADAVRTVAPAPLTPHKMWRRNAKGFLQPLLHVRGLKDPWNQARQILPATWIQTGSVDVAWSRTILEKNSMTGTRIIGYREPLFVDIDTSTDFCHAESLMLLMDALAGRGPTKKRVFCFDLDGVLARSPANLNYARARPIPDIIRFANALKSRGHRVVVHTARGSLTGIDWRKTTLQQLTRWGLQFDELIMGKPTADCYIDDRALHVAHLAEFLKAYPLGR